MDSPDSLLQLPVHHNAHHAPAKIGSYQFFTVLGLTLFGVDKTSATGFSLVVFMLLTLPLLVIGFLALSRSGMSLVAIRDELRRP